MKHVSFKKILMCIFLCNILITYQICSDQNGYRLTDTVDNDGNKLAEWTIAVYMGARNNLGSYAAGNLQDMANATRNDKINVVAQWDQSGKKGAWRYSAKNGVVNLEHYSNVNNPTDMSEKLINFTSWVTQKYPSKRIALILWNHGSGPVAPKFGDPMKFFMQNRDILSNPSIDPSEYFNSCKVLSELYQEEESNIINPRDILFDDEYKTCLNNKDLRTTFLQITSPNVLGKKIDLIGFDACFMGSTEIAYQLRNCGDFMVASPELELAKGWNYTNWIARLSQNPNRQAIDVATDIAIGFEELYKNKTQLFSQTVINLSKIEELNDSSEKIVKSFEECAKVYSKKLLNATLKARKSCVQFSPKFYIDQHSFFKQMIMKILQEEGISPTKNSISENNIFLYDQEELLLKKYHPSVVTLIEALKNGMLSLEKIIIKNCKSQLFKDSAGLSIYFPSNKNIDSSYFDNDFARTSRWSYFLQNICSFMN